MTSFNLIILFSERHGITPPKQIQDHSIDVALRNGLWNALDTFLTQTQSTFYELIWINFFKNPRDTLLGTTSSAQHKLIRCEFFTMEWFYVYDLIEFICCLADKFKKPDESFLPFDRSLVLSDGKYIRSNEEFMLHHCQFYFSDHVHFKRFTKECNEILEKEISAWRIVGGKICKITSEAETDAVEGAMQSQIEGVGQHITSAIFLLYNRENPDYKNAIKESISAVELICAKITKQHAPILSKALDKMEKDGIINIHPALKASFEKLYGYTSSGSGIRHANINNDEITFELAQFFLIACSAFTNYLIVLATKKGVNL